MQTYTYVSKGKFELMEKPKPVLMHERDAIVTVSYTHLDVYKRQGVKWTASMGEIPAAIFTGLRMETDTMIQLLISVKITVAT